MVKCLESCAARPCLWEVEGWGEHQDKNVRPEGTQESDKKADMVQLGKNSSRKGSE